ncbi:MAG: NAD(P)/FAD-dependent oxidoreductase [Pseudonocardia sp.]|nr:NAD(P)/FAD-dependent oxidoreductase [Pseudonocardia sp.]
MTQVAIIGAGPYGLSIAANLRARGVAFRIFGTPLGTWRQHMPEGMTLKSGGFASNLCDAQGKETLAAYCADRGLPFHRTDRPVELDVFIEYAMDFQRRLVPDLEETQVVSLDQTVNGFTLKLEDGEVLNVPVVVAAVGITHFKVVPDELAGLPTELMTHSSAHRDLSGFAGKDVTVVGAGASAVDVATLVAEAGATTRVITRSKSVRFSGPLAPEDRGVATAWCLRCLQAWSATRRVRSSRVGRLLSRFLRPTTGIGPGWRSWACVNLPSLFRFLPGTARLTIVKRHLGPKSPHVMKARFDAKVSVTANVNITAATVENGKVRLALTSTTGERCEVVTDHVIAATGYYPDVERLQFISPALRRAIRTHAGMPVLSGTFESSVSGLYFVGPPAVNTFGPLMRFMVGSEYVAPVVSRSLARHTRKTTPGRRMAPA